MRTARAKGLAERAVVYRHALRNSLLPVVTFIGWWGGRLLGGVVIMEIIFAVPGMGTALVQAVSYRDYPTVQAIVFVMALIFLTLNLVGRPALRVARSADPARVSDAGVQARRLLRRQPLGVAGAVVVLALLIAVALLAPRAGAARPEGRRLRASTCRPGASSRWAPTTSGATC